MSYDIVGMGWSSKLDEMVWDVSIVEKYVWLSVYYRVNMKIFDWNWLVICLVLCVKFYWNLCWLWVARIFVGLKQPKLLIVKPINLRNNLFNKIWLRKKKFNLKRLREKFWKCLIFILLYDSFVVHLNYWHE